MSILDTNKFRNNLQKYVQVKFQNYKLEAEERIISLVIAIIITFILLVTLSLIVLFGSIALAHLFNEYAKNDYTGYFIMVGVYGAFFLLLLFIMSSKKSRNILYQVLTNVIEPFFNFILKKILKQPENEHKNPETEIQNILKNKKLNRDEKQKQLEYIEDRYEQELGKSLKTAQKAITNTVITGLASYISFRLIRKMLSRKKQGKQVVVVKQPSQKQKDKPTGGIVKSIKRKVTNMAINTILDTVSDKVQQNIQNQTRKPKKDED